MPLTVFHTHRVREALKARSSFGVDLLILLSIVALAAARPRWWMYALLPVIGGAFGLWGILERALAERGTNRSARYERTITTAQWIAVTIGTAAAIVTTFAVLGILLGPIIS